MRAALLASLFFMICAIAAAFGFPTVHADGEAITGVHGFLIGTVFALLPPSIVLAVRKFSSSQKRNESSQ